MYGEHLPDPVNRKKPGVVNFAKQDAAYLLQHDREIVYVGKTVCLASRLHEHTASPTPHNRWDRFSWFGFRKVIHDESGGGLGEADLPTDFAVCDLMAVVDGIFIEAVEPRNNRQGVKGFNDLAYGQVSFAEAEKRMKKGFR